MRRQQYVYLIENPLPVFSTGGSHCKLHHVANFHEEPDLVIRMPLLCSRNFSLDVVEDFTELCAGFHESQEWLRLLWFESGHVLAHFFRLRDRQLFQARCRWLRGDASLLIVLQLHPGQMNYRDGARDGDYGVISPTPLMRTKTHKGRNYQR